MILGGTSSPLFSFNATLGRLYVCTPALKMVFDSGAVVHLSDSVRGEVLLDTDISINMPSPTFTFIGFASSTLPNGDGTVHERTCNAAAATFAQSGMVGTLTYSPCYRSGSPIAGTSLVYTFTIDIFGDISISATATEAEASYAPYTLDVPIMNFAKTSVITRSQEVAYADANITIDYISGADVPLAIGKGSASCFGVWSENNKIINDYVKLFHYQSNYSHIVLKTLNDPKQVAINPLVMSAGPWRFSAQADWLGVTKRWRTTYTGIHADIKPLWQKSPSWIQNVHCRYGKTHPISAPTHWSDVVDTIPAANFVADSPGVEYNGFGDYMILYGQIHPRLTDSEPSDWELPTILSLGIKMIGYFYWNAIHGIPADRLAQADVSPYLGTWTYNNGVPPTDFNPDYSGAKTEAAWLAYWNDCSIQSSPGSYVSWLHPGSSKFATFIQMFRDYCAWWNLAGCFWDTASSDRDTSFLTVAPSIRVIAGQDFMAGQKVAMQNVYQDLVIVPEYFRVDLMAYIFYAYDVRQWAVDSKVMTHPLRTALTGSYSWSLDQSINTINIVNYSHDIFATMGCIPEFALVGEGDSPTFGAEYFIARAKLFCDYEMFNDLPTTWATGALAYYRCNTSNYIRFIKRATGRYAFIEEAGPDVVRLQHELVTGAVIPGGGTLAVTFTDTYTATPTVTATGGATVTNLTTSGCTLNLAGGGTVNWMVFGH